MIIITAINSYGQIRGQVLDISNRSPLPGANILLNDSVVSVTDQEGNFIIDAKSLPATLTARYIGYEPASVQVTEHKQIITFELKASNYMLGEVVISAYEGKQRIIETPGSIAMLPQKEMKIDNDIYFIPSLNRVTGIYAHSGTYNTNRITIRGIGSRSLFITSKIRAYYDNIPLTTGDGETTVEDIDPNLIDRMETIKGPSSSLYGAGLGGTLLIRSESPSNQEKYLKYSITGGSYGYLKNDLSFAYGNDKNRLGVVLNKIKSDGYRENNQYDRFTGGIHFKSYLTKKTTINFLSTFIGLNAQIPSSLNREMYESNPEAAAPNRQPEIYFRSWNKSYF
jgi:iron complex outermembrane receptor protein